MKRVFVLTFYVVNLGLQVNTNSAVSRFRILAPEFVCPKDNNAVIEKPDNTVITLQSNVGSELQVRWTVRWKPLNAPTQRFTLQLWKTVRALEAKLNGPQPEPSVFDIENSELLSGVDYTFDVSEVGQDEAETKTFHIDNTRGDQKLHIDGRNDMVSVILVGGQQTYVDVEFELEAQVTVCFPTQNYYLIWNVASDSGDVVNVSRTAGTRLRIPRDTLQYGSTYHAHCQLVSQSDGHFITQTGVAFKVPPRGVEVYLNFDYLVISADQPLTVEATVVNHDNYDQISLQWTCSHENESCEHLGFINGSSILFPSGLLDPGDYYITLAVGVMNEITTTNATIIAVDTELPVIQVVPLHRTLNEGNIIALTATASNISPTCSLTWYFASQEYLSYNELLVNDTCEECQHGEAITDALTIQSLEENFLNELIDYSNETEWRQITAEFEAKAGRARFVVQCGCSLTFNCDRKGVVYADIHFEINESPKASELMISPESGTAMETIFRISTLPAVDPDGILRYSFYCRVGEDSLLLGSYVDYRAVETLLPYIDGGIDVWVEVCDVLGACSSSDVKIVSLAAGEGRTVATLVEDAAAHVRRCELMLLSRVVVSAIVTYTNADQSEPLAMFNAALMQSLQDIDKDKCLQDNYDHFVNLVNWLQIHGVDTGNITY
ncbi:uncharacterized protein LOC128677059 [Plodia interpunctella]|uniref:uncharacterized protein LOC128677059 n=1 Tax=Plodia interpunctella TaxID=58824 RepID=UPI0023681285|nr:uncharacterized protein LOC128677059 [Plodia interpunctella]